MKMISGFFHVRLPKPLAIALLFYFFITHYPVSSEPERKLQTLFVTADVLNVRIRPDKKSDKIGILPFGSKIQVERAQTFEIQNGAKIYWYYFPEINGYVFSDFLSETEPALGKKKAVLYKFYGDRCALYNKQRMTLYANTVDLYIDQQEEGGSCSTGLLRGKYTFRQNALVISGLKGMGLKDHCPSFDDNKTSIQELEKRLLTISKIKGDLILYYDPVLDGFVTENFAQDMTSNGWKINKSKCSFEKYSECKYSEKLILESEGYFCFTEHSL
ncbi:SH3 domain-containing protein [Leptospira haakeii]|uniref:SH3b domain-containing protein n=1 Tax=Leptospira haakeii TaxID=2023198 RepID=A0ABX4PQF3_9LEPT|nr:SH3 domain-containing protein [Leptospira haakeii]PKA17521.1 hypothetical protein CH363_02420 [Leptospira haakeii]PKA21245.1 hypothetical protein CH377_02420 [Leptospira haakeii]